MKTSASSVLVLVSTLLVSCGKDVGAQDTAAATFVQPTNIGPLTAPENWPMFFDRAPENRAPDGAASYVVVIGSGNPTANPNRIGPRL